MSNTRTYLDFERPLAELDGKIDDLKALNGPDGIDVTDEVARLEAKADKQLRAIYTKLDPWEKTKVARHPARPHFCDYISGLVTDFTDLAGDRKYGEDEALIGGPGKIRGQSVMIMGHEKGHDTDTRLQHNFGMANPEGYRKAVRLMDMAERFHLPVISLVDTAGAFPGRGAEERGQAEAIARSIDKGLSLKVPFISIIIGEGGSGGAVAIATANKVLMLEHSIYSVISPEGCASILWRDSERSKDAAKAMKITAKDLKQLGIVDDIIAEPLGGAHRDPQGMISAVGDTIIETLTALSGLDATTLVRSRQDKFLSIGRTLLD
ncbi:MAG TPA: acetyl-CoA carboxylase carboxyltransferase subunit alpha [Hellea balneolensis]|uniref:Acetyl-coenzyme A carboxylase carboxyl transferase subunit alpha n=1 Tax=Hellea balneolensis TaxID=287478 RepID=A0A7C5QWN5_9PROT|nr:acetyl-CoA carboxylase carboxyltransferase subunit alpha [Hellea balneolensis]